MKKRCIRKQNKQRMINLIREFDFKSYNFEFYQSYSLAVGTFKLKEFSDWKFGIWLNYKNKSFDIFGENIYMIDKFKPSRCTLSFSAINVSDFQNELKIIQQNKDADWVEYLQNAAEAKEREDRLHRENFKIYQSVKSAIEELNKQYSIKDDVEIRITDYNTKYSKCYPRYKIDLYCTDDVLKDNDLYNKILLDCYNKLSNTKKWAKGFGLDEYQFSNISLYSPEEYEYTQNLYPSWNDSFDEYIINLIQ